MSLTVRVLFPNLRLWGGGGREGGTSLYHLGAAETGDWPRAVLSDRVLGPGSGSARDS